MEEASWFWKTIHRLQNVVAIDEKYITLLSGAYKVTPEEAPTLSVIIDFLSCFRVLLGTPFSRTTEYSAHTKFFFFFTQESRIVFVLFVFLMDGTLVLPLKLCMYILTLPYVYAGRILYRFTYRPQVAASHAGTIL